MSRRTDGFAALQSAAAAGDLAAVTALLDAGADPNEDPGAPGGWSPLMSAAYHGRLAVVRLLVERGARLDAVEIDRWRTPLDLATAGKRKTVVAYLVSVGAPTGEKVTDQTRYRPPRRP